MYKLLFHEDAEADLDALWEVDEQAAARIDTVLDEIAADQESLDALTVFDFGSDSTKSDFHVENWVTAKPLWRLKVWDLDGQAIPYRVIYGFIPGKRYYYVLGIMPRSWNYNPRDERSIRIRSAYTDLGGW